MAPQKMTPQEKQLKIQQLLSRLDALQGGSTGLEVNQLLEEEAFRASELVKNSPTRKAVSILSEELAKLKGDPRLTNLERTLEGSLDETDFKFNQLITVFGEALSQLQLQMQEADTQSKESSSEEMKKILGELSTLSSRFELDYAMLDDQTKTVASTIPKVREEVLATIKPLTDKSSSIEKLLGETGTQIQATNLRVSDVEETVQKLGDDFNSRLKRVQTAVNERGSGNMNRNVAVGGNTSVLSKWTDMNLKAGANVTITYQSNDTTGYTDITFASTGGGGGSVTGIIRSIQTISASQTADSVPGTDYVYLCSAGVKLTLPTAVGNSNLYTVKNISNSSVLVSGTIDNDASGVIMPVKYTSIDIVSNSVDWDIT